MTTTPCPHCGAAMRQRRRGATLKKHGPAYTCPVNENEYYRDERGHWQRHETAVHPPSVRWWEQWEIDEMERSR